MGDDLGDVLSQQRLLHPGVELFGRSGVSAQPLSGELLSAHHAGQDIDHPDIVLGLFEPEHTGEGMLAEFGGVVAGAAFVGHIPRRGGEVENSALTMGTKHGQERLGDMQRAQHIDLEHPAPVIRAASGHRICPQRAAGVVDQGVDSASGCDLV